MPMTDDADRTSRAFLRERIFWGRVAVLAFLCSFVLVFAIVRGLVLMIGGAG